MTPDPSTATVLIKGKLGKVIENPFSNKPPNSSMSKAGPKGNQCICDIQGIKIVAIVQLGNRLVMADFIESPSSAHVYVCKASRDVAASPPRGRSERKNYNCCQPGSTLNRSDLACKCVSTSTIFGTPNSFAY